MKKNLGFSVLAVALLLGFGSMGFASPFAFDNTVLNPGSLSTSGPLLWTHDLEPVFAPYLSGGGEIEITEATLKLGVEISGEKSYLYTITGYGIDDGIGDGVGLGFLFSAGGSFSGDQTFTLEQAALDAIEGGKMDVVLQLFLSGTGTAKVNSSTLSGTASVVPIPTALLLLGSGIVCVVSYRRKSRV